MKLTTMILRKVAVTGFGAIGLATFAISANAALINGDFSTNGGGGQLGYNTTATGWSVPAPNGSYFFLFTSATQAGAGVTGQYGSLGLISPVAPPGGGAFVGADPAFQNGAISQTVGGLTIGAQYVLTFNWAGAQQSGFSGATTEGWTVNFGSQSDSTTLDSTPSHGFSAWQTQSYTFTASATSQLLSFLATGGPSQTQPPFSLLDGVSLTQVTTTPEPASWAMLLGGLGLLGGARFTRAKNWFKR